jgi:translation initiation factor 5A
VALDIFTSKKYEDLCPTSHNVEVPFVKRTEMQCLSADSSTGEVSLLLESGDTKDDLNLPNFVTVGEPTEDDNKIASEIVEAVDKADKTVIVAVLEACGQQKIVGVKLSDS